MYFEQAKEDAGQVSISVGARVGLAVTAVGILVLGIYPQPFLDFATESMQMLGLVF
jgi:NADH:ubiquinone oxidoreductase subunit 2 (subunit N)